MTPDAFFDCKDTAQVDSLVKELWKKFPQYTETDIRRAIKVCCDNLKDQTTKEKFIECAESNLHWLDI
jgi:hypothetical protein